MKKVVIMVAAMLISVAAVAQNKAIDALVEKYAEIEGFTVVNLDGDAIKSLAGMAASQIGKDSEDGKTVDINGMKVDINEVLKNIAALNVIVRNSDDEVFAGDLRDAIARGKYSPMVSLNQDEMAVKVLSADIKRGKLKKNKEIVVSVIQKGQVIFVRFIGKIDPELIAQLAAQMQKS